MVPAMFRWLRRTVSLVSLAAFLSSGIFLIPPAADAWRILRRWDDPAVAADIQLAGLLPADYAREAERALAEDDPELAGSILALAEERHVALPPELQPRVTEALAARPGVIGQVWNGAVYGEGDTAAGLAAAVTTDFMVIGDLRDLVREGLAYPDYDPIVVALAAAGVGLTAATAPSAGTAIPLKLGASVLKLARRTGKLGLALGDDLLRLARRAVDPDALEATLRAGRRLDWPAARLEAQAILRAPIRAELMRTGEAVGAIAAARGPRAALDTLKAAESTAEVTRLARVAEKLRGGYRGALRLAPRLGKVVARTIDRLAGILGWLLSAAAWLLWLAWLSLRVTVRGTALAARGVRRFVRRSPPTRTIASLPAVPFRDRLL